MKCATCGATYRREESFETKDAVRTVCGCEARAQACARKKRGSGCGKVVQAVLAEDGSPEFYLCARHAAPDAVQGVEESPAEALKRKGDAVRRAEAAADKAPARREKLPPYDHTERWVKSAIKGDATPRVCQGCRHEFAVEASKVVMEDALFELACPKCDGRHLHYALLDNTRCPVCRPPGAELRKEAERGKKVGAAPLRR